MKELKWISGAIALLLVSFGLDRLYEFLRVINSQMFVYNNLVTIILMFSNLLIILMALAIGFLISRDSPSRLAAFLLLFGGLLVIISPLLPPNILGNITRFGLISYSSLAGDLLVLVGIFGLFRTTQIHLN